MSLFNLLLVAAEKAPAGLNLKYGSVALGVFLMGVGLIRWSVRAYLDNAGIQPVKGLRAPKMSPQFRMLQEMGMATGEQLSTMDAAERERLFAEAMIRRMAPNPSAAPQTAAEATIASVLGGRGAREANAPALPIGGFRVSCAPNYLFCPACGATLGDEKTPIGFLTSCLTCKRVLKARLEGARVTIEAAGG
jgi:hypothetical protein